MRERQGYLRYKISVHTSSVAEHEPQRDDTRSFNADLRDARRRRIRPERR